MDGWINKEKKRWERGEKRKEKKRESSRSVMNFPFTSPMYLGNLFNKHL